MNVNPHECDCTREPERDREREHERETQRAKPFHGMECKSEHSDEDLQVQAN